MKIGINIENNLKIILEEIFNYEFIDLRENSLGYLEVKIVLIDFETTNFHEYLLEYKKNNLKVIVLLGEKDIREMRKLFLSGLINDCIVRKDIFQVEESINSLKLKEEDIESIYLSDTFKKGFYNMADINFVMYSSVSRKTEFHLINSEIFDIKKNFSEIEDKLMKSKFFYKLDRGTIINLKSIKILDYKEELIIFKDKSYLYTSKAKLKELESKYLTIKNQFFIGV